MYDLLDVDHFLDNFEKEKSLPEYFEVVDDEPLLVEDHDNDDDDDDHKTAYVEIVLSDSESDSFHCLDLSASDQP